MSAQQLLIQDQQSKADDLQRKMCRMTSDMIMYDDYMVGCGVSDLEMEHALIMQEILCTNNCDLVEYIKDRIWGKIHPEQKCRDKNSSLDKLLRHLKKHQQTEDDNECLESVVFWTEAEW